MLAYCSLLVYIITIKIIYGKDASYTCCFGDKCPLPAFQTFQGSADQLLNSPIIDERKCCPSNCYTNGYTSGIDTIRIKWGIESMCVCKCPQISCPIYSIGWTCDNEYYMTAEGCPDFKVGQINLLQSISAQKNNPDRISKKCTFKLYDHANGATTTWNPTATLHTATTTNSGSNTAIQRVMNQRCTAESICVHRIEKYDGTYNKTHQFYNGFDQYTNELYTIRLKYTSSYYSGSISWSVINNNGVKVDHFATNSYTRYDITQVYGIKEGVCTPSPTRWPTKKPTFRPSWNPTKKPTFRPTRNPTRKPTPAPTRSPTLKPTSAPTYPTMEPTESPTPDPTKAPTKEPTVPTLSPTKNPTKRPTSSPTKRPTRDPTKRPTQNPTVPSLAPTKSPTKNPTVSPTKNPTLSPTRSPTKAPTVPTTSPSLSPSLNPTTPPTLSPSRSPTTPTLSPSQAPTVVAASMASSNGSTIVVVLVIVIIVLLIVIVIMGTFWWRNRQKQDMETNVQYVNMSQAANADNIVYYAN